METLFYKNRTRWIFYITCAAVISLGIFIQGCSLEEDEQLDESILNSRELQEYVVAGADLYKSMARYADFLNKIDFSTLQTTYEPGWIKIVHFPPPTDDIIKIEVKLQILNEKKVSFQEKFPQFSTFSQDVGINYFNKCIESSITVKGKLLEMGYYFSRPLLKTQTEIFFTSMQEVHGHLYAWQWGNYVELTVLGLNNGTWAVVWNSANTPFYNLFDYFEKNDNWYLDNECTLKIISYGHTHHWTSTSNPTVYTDPFTGKVYSDYVNVPSGVDRFIWYYSGWYYY